MGPWFEAKAKGNFPVIGIEGSRTERCWPSAATAASARGRRPKYTVEHSVYVHRDHRGRGLGLQIMRSLIEAARRNDVHAMMGGIDATNAGSIALHERLGFKHVGTLPQVGFKFGRWLDLAFYQLLLDTPANPVDG